MVLGTQKRVHRFAVLLIILFVIYFAQCSKCSLETSSNQQNEERIPRGKGELNKGEDKKADQSRNENVKSELNENAKEATLLLEGEGDLSSLVQQRSSPSHVYSLPSPSVSSRSPKLLSFQLCNEICITLLSVAGVTILTIIVCCVIVKVVTILKQLRGKKSQRHKQRVCQLFPTPYLTCG